jgi:hypothetical protein
VTAWAPLVAGIGGLGWGAFLVVVVRTAFPPLDGLERVPQRELARFLSTWCLAALERLAVLAAVTLPVTAVASVYGMNVIVNQQTHVPQLLLVLALMVAMSAALLRWTKRQGWW